jgi:imidazole glycerol phosphate synthase subunit HisF
MVEAAVRLELEGADGVFIQDRTAGPRGRWLESLSSRLFIPLYVEAPFKDLDEVAGALESGADKVVVGGFPAAQRLLEGAADRFGRSRLVTAVTAFRIPEGAWRADLGSEDRDLYEWMADLGQMGAGEMLVQTPGNAEGLFQGCARLTMPVLARCNALQAAHILLDGAEGAVYPLPGSPMELKAALAPLGLPLRA